MSWSFTRNMTRHGACAFKEEIMGDKVRHLGLTAAALCAMAGLTATTADAGGAVTTSLFLSLSGAVFI